MHPVGRISDVDHYILGRLFLELHFRLVLRSIVLRFRVRASNHVTR